MVKDTNTSRCQETESGCKFGAIVRLDKFKTNSGFMFKYTVDLTGFELSDEQVSILGYILKNNLWKYLDSMISTLFIDVQQPELF